MEADATLGDGNGIWQNLQVSVVELRVPSSGTPTQRVPIVVMSVDSQSGEPQFECYGWPIFDSRFMKFVFRISGGMKF